MMDKYGKTYLFHIESLKAQTTKFISHIKRVTQHICQQTKDLKKKSLKCVLHYNCLKFENTLVTWKLWAPTTLMSKLQ